ncbi:GNAT family N-acetyltransferase [Dysgonomonas sp. ZJ709]|uniref:GNAT family N-acetyltransferase n=1 Tax=Dysgonomonas sp. ZJ709 TaxID=2709797 RepID=UPI0013EC7231|nr:GNAT family N-acetyltransferase [Dysgonomonas sp. ZJ709]
MKIEYSNKIPEINSFFALYESTGWNNSEGKTKEELYNAIEKSWYIISAFADNNLIGFGRVISDGYLHAFIVDLIILPEYKQQGIGTEILNRLVDQIKSAGINDIQLFCAKEKKEFYLKNNFEERSPDAPGMQYKN